MKINREIKQLMILNKYKELVGILETFNLRLDVWEFSLVIIDEYNNKIAVVGDTYIDWEKDDE
jgi:hypothetical protein